MAVPGAPFIMVQSPVRLRPVQLAWLAAAVFVVSTGFFVAAVIPVVSALVAEHTPDQQRARRFAWLGAMSLLGFLVGPALNVLAQWIGSGLGVQASSSLISTRLVLVLSAVLGCVMIIGLGQTLPPARSAEPPTLARPEDLIPDHYVPTSLLWLNGGLMFVLAGFEVGIVLQGQQETGETSHRAAWMFAECSLVMLAVNAVLFFTGLLEKVAPRRLVITGLLLASAGLLILTQRDFEPSMYLGVSLAAAGTGLVMPVIAFLAAGTSVKRLGLTMGGLAAAAGLGQTLGSTAGGWLYSATAQWSFGWLAVPLLSMLVLVTIRPPRWSIIAAKPQSTAELLVR